MLRKRELRRLTRIGLAAVLLVGADPVRAGEGVIEINQTRVELGEVTPGDTPGFPVGLTRPGSYALTGDLTVSDATLSAIVILASGVTLDLRGFSIVGPSAGAADGIHGATASDTVVRNGHVRDFGGDGIELSPRCRVESLHLTGNGGVGIRGGNACQVSAIFADSNDGGGVDLGFASTIVGSQITNNGVSQTPVPGLRVGAQSIVKNSHVSGNSGDGIAADNGCLVLANTSNQNSGDAIEVGESSIVRDNTARLNGVHALNRTQASDPARESAYSGNIFADNGRVGEPQCPTACSQVRSTGFLYQGFNVCNGSQVSTDCTAGLQVPSP